LIFKYQIANEIINESNSENTLQFNGTSKWGEIFFTFDISSPERLFTGNISGLYIKTYFSTCPFGQLTKKSTCPTQSFSCPKKLIKITKTRE
jgi:hypothetical protein